jgi:hypothetical protein
MQKMFVPHRKHKYGHPQPVTGPDLFLYVDYNFACGSIRCETWSLTVREEHKLRVFENRVLRRIFGPKRDGVTAGWRKLHNEELHNLYSSPSIIRIIKSRRMRWAGHVARMGEKRNVNRILVRKPGKETTRKTKTKMDR